MAQYDIFANPSRAARTTYPFVIALQSNVSTGNRTIIVAPIAPRHKANIDDRAMIPVDIDGAPHTINLYAIAAIPSANLSGPVAAAPDIRERMPRALDYIFLGL
ncbi:MAG TPA: CcdB family protein [Caulobacterales bacterium]|nr:CcdB family protein [Caulobacterales bacterium]